MKTLFATTALVLGFAIPATAMTDPADMLTGVERAEVRLFAPQTDLDSLTADQITAIRGALHNGEDSDQRRAIRAIAN